MRNLKYVAVLIALSLLARIAFAQQSGDAAGVKAAAKAFQSAVQRGDAGAIAQMLIVENDPQQLMAQAYANFILAGKHLAEAAKAKFPDSTNPLAISAVPPEEAAKIDSAVVTFDHDTATLKTTGPASPMTFRNSGGAWHVFVSQPDSAPEHRAQQLALIGGMTDALNQATAELNADKYGNVQDLENAVKQKLGTVLAKAMQSDLPTSRPTTRP
jgi:hypothetical protein